MVQQLDAEFLCATSALVYSLTVELGVGVGVGDRVGVGVGVGVDEGVGVGVGVGERVGVEVGVREGDGLAATLRVADGVGVGEIEAAAVADGAGVGDVLIVTPLFQTLLLPCFIQVNFLPPYIATAPKFLQLAPAFGVTALAKVKSVATNKQAINRAEARRM